MDADVGGEMELAVGRGGGFDTGVPRGSRSAAYLREAAAASQTFRAETRFLTGNFVRPHLHPHSPRQRQLLRRRLVRVVRVLRFAERTDDPARRSMQLRE